jgi:hypothetical protein
MNEPTTDRILFALYCLSRDTCEIDATSVGRAAGVTATLAGEALITLEGAGLVDATRARLTMLGLARAARLSVAGGGGLQVDLRHARSRGVQREAEPLAAAAVVSEETRRGESGLGAY